MILFLLLLNFEGIRVFQASGFIHRDIKCNNILLHSPPGSGRVYAKISDFGFAKKESLTKEENSVAGTTPYIVLQNNFMRIQLQLRKLIFMLLVSLSTNLSHINIL
ncbi:MAG: hypothetical protein EZS28_034467 [Streblomastix strix]|uniref:Protein kinase domain-containing protein n=1 Tax=Streblomastix strix TaxID=222440 RepID=A0A5J4UGT3_9EUKA|nr:MAG: hypothetical protein EZS28_034467 [Streblomastix strix]